jgi:hypothetical protein
MFSTSVFTVPQVVHLTQLPHAERAAELKAAGVRKQLGEGFGVCMTQGLREDAQFLRDIELEESTFVESSQGEVGVRVRGASSAGGRCGWFSTPAALFRQPDFAKYARDSGHHAMVIMHPENLQRMLLLYPAGRNARADRALPSNAQSADGPGQPRVHELYPGRNGLNVPNAGNVRLQRQRGPSFTHNLQKALAALHSLLMLATLGLAEDDGQDMLLDGAVARTIQYTYDLFRRHETCESALEALACLKGFYVNRWPASFHTDHDKHMETWSIRQQEPAPHAPGPTWVPQLHLALTADANATVWTAALSNLMHAASDLGGLAVEHRGRGANDAFHLQSRGAANLPLWI